MKIRNITVIRYIFSGLFMSLPFQLSAQGEIEHVDSLPLVNQPNGSVDVIDERRMNKGLVVNSLDALNGQAAGVNISSGDDRRAMLSSVRVRGTTSLTGGNDPLVIIDGVYSDLSTLNSLYPADIESFTILKNAAETAPYGSRGASGVIQVVTKKSSGGQFHISYDGNVGFESVYKNLEMLSGQQYRALLKEQGITYNDGGYDTDFPDGLTRTGFVQNHHVAFSGGGNSSGYRASLAFMEHKTILKEHGNNNFVAKIDLNQKAFDDKLLIDFGVFGSSASNDNIFDVQKLFYSAAAQNPTFPLYRNSSGEWDKNMEASQINTPMAILQEKDNDRLLNFNTHLNMSAEQTRTFTLSFFSSYSYNSSENAQYLPTWVWAQGQAYRAHVRNEEWLVNGEAKWNDSFGASNQHALAVDFLAEYQKRVQRGFFTTVKGFSDNSIGYDNLSAGSIIPYGGTGSSYENPALSSFMLQASYTYNKWLTLTANARVDGSSMFSDGNKWGFFPSVSGSVDMLRVIPTLATVKFINGIKLRAGYGITGNTGGIDSYNSRLLLNPTGRVSWNGTPVSTLGLIANSNPDLKWETRGTFNIGADLELWNSRIVMTAEYYYSKTKDMLYMYDVPVPAFTFNKLLANLGSMSNSGFELGVGITPLQTRDMELNVNVNMSYQKNKLISLSGNYNGIYLSAANITTIGSLNGAGFHGGDNNITYQIIGQPLGVFYLPHCTGLSVDADGHKTYEIADLDKDGTVDISDGKDRYIAGQATPKVTLGTNISFRWKQFDISIQANGAFGHKIYNGTSLSYMNMSSFPSYNVMRKAPKEAIYDQVATDYWLESGDYLNIDYLTLGWTMPKKMLLKYISGLRLSLSVNNLATITGYSGLTPMINSYVVDNTMGIDDKRSYPPYRSYSFALSIQF